MCFIRILCDEDLHTNEFLSYAEKLSRVFIQQYQNIYRHNVVYNIHCLIHIVDDVRKFAKLDSISLTETMLTMLG